MYFQKCHKCGLECEVNGKNIELGTLIVCKCGCKFDFISHKAKKDPLPPPPPPPPPFETGTTATQTSTKTPPVSIPARMPDLVWQSFAILMGICLIVAFIFGLSMITTLLFTCFILFPFFRMNRTLLKTSHNKTFRYFLFDKGVELTACLWIVVSFYAVLSWIVDGTSDETTLYYLSLLENSLDSLKTFLQSYLIFKPGFSALIMALLLAADIAVAYFISRESSAVGEESGSKKERVSPVARYLFYQKWSKRVFLVVTLLCSFTFFGNVVLGERVAHLRARTDKIKEGYKEIKEEVETLIAGAVHQRVYEKTEKAYSALPKGVPGKPSPINFHDIIYRRGEKAAELDNTYRTYTDTPSTKTAQHKTAVDELVNQPPVPKESSPEPISYAQEAPESPPVKEPVSEQVKLTARADDLSVSKVEKIKTEINSKSKLYRAVSLFKRADGSDFLCQFPKWLVSAVKSQAIGGLIEEVPFLGPIVDSFTGAITKMVDESIKSKSTEAIDEVLRNPEKFEMTVNKVANEIANSVPIEVSPESVQKARAAAAPFEQTITRTNVKIEEINRAITKTAAAAPEPPPSSLPPIEFCP